MQVQEHTSQLGRWRTAHRSSHPSLRTFVKGYLASSSFLPTPIRERHLPSTEVPLVVNFGAPHRQRDAAKPENWTSRDGAWIVGLQESHQLSEAAGERDFLIVRFTPLGAHLFLRTPMHLIAGQAVELSALDPALAALVVGRAGAARSWSDRFDRIEALIAERLSTGTAPSGLSYAWRKLEATGGRIPLGRLVSEIDCSHRTLIAQFRSCVGQTPKAIGRLFRFGSAMRSLGGLIRNDPASRPYIERESREDWRGPALRWADIAADCGYFDQSHFIKEFRQFAGATPTEFLRRMSNVA